VASREETVYRLTPRENEEVNSLWMCDQGRLGFHYIHGPDRLSQPLAGRGAERKPAAWPEIIPQLAARLREFKPEQIAIIASGRMTNEEAYLLSEVRRALGGEAVLTDLVPRKGHADGILRSADLNPNSRGAALFGLSHDGHRLGDILHGIDSGRIQALLVLHENRVHEDGWPASTMQQLKLLAVLGLMKSATTDAADFVLPGASFAEKRGSMINGAGRLQRLNRAISVQGMAMDDWEILLQLKAALGGGNGLHTIEEVFKAMAETTPALAGLTLSRIGDLGVQLQLDGVTPGAARAAGNVAV
jgi:NADH-quinone oxidoreductase subunit G